MTLTLIPPIPRADRLASLFGRATVVLFAGLGGVCIGVERAYVRGGYRDRYIDLAVNHWDTAVDVHALNHPLTEHLHADVWEVDPSDVLPGREIAYLHLSPDCVDFSKAKGGKPKRKHIRALADVGLVWAAKRRPDVITLENVEEFRQWGPLLASGQPDPDRRGEEFARWVGALEDLGYVVEHRELRACDYGTPTTRKRLFVIARRDGKEIIWPERTHGQLNDACGVRSSQHDGSGAIASQRRLSSLRQVEEAGSDHVSKRLRPSRIGCEAESLQPDWRGLRRCDPRSDGRARKNDADSTAKLKPFRTAAECIDWQQPMLSIFATRAEARAWAERLNVGRPKHERLGVPQRPLKPKTQQRIAGGLDKWVLKAAEPFIVRVAHGDQCSGSPRWGESSHSVDQPLPTVAASKDFAAVDVEIAGYAGTFNHGGDEHRTADVRSPLSTVTAANDARGVVSATLSTFTVPRYGERPGQDPRSGSVETPSPTVTGTANGAQLVAVSLANYHGEKGSESRGQRPDEPIRTLDTQNRFAPVAAHLIKFRGESPGTSAAEPMDTITAGSGHGRPAGAGHAMGVAAVYLSHMYTSNTCGGQGSPEKPLKTITSGGQHAKVCVVYLSAYYGSKASENGHAPAEPLPTATGHDRFGLVSLETTPHWVFPPSTFDRVREVGRWAEKMLGEKVRDHLMWVEDLESGERFPLLFVRIKGEIHLVTDIAMRMLRPRELARAQGFPDDYILDRTADGRPVSKADQVKLIGNSVCPQLAEAIAYANVVQQGVLDAAGKAVPA